MFKIVGSYRDGEIEILDKSDSIIIANIIAEDFREIFGSEWDIYIK